MPPMSCQVRDPARFLSTSHHLNIHRGLPLVRRWSNFELRASYSGSHRPPTACQEPLETASSISIGEEESSSPRTPSHQSDRKRKASISKEQASVSTRQGSGTTSDGPRRYHSISLREAFLRHAPGIGLDDYESIAYSGTMSRDYFQPVAGSVSRQEQRIMHGWDHVPFAMPCDEEEQLVREMLITDVIWS